MGTQAHLYTGSATITGGGAPGAAAPLTTVGLRPPSVSGGQPPPDQRAASRLGILILIVARQAVPLRRFHAFADPRLAGVTAFRSHKQVWGQRRTVVVTISRRLLEGQLAGINRALRKKRSALRTLRSKVARSQQPGARGRGYSRASVEKHLRTIASGQYVAQILKTQISETDGVLSFRFHTDWAACQRFETQAFGQAHPVHRPRVVERPGHHPGQPCSTSCGAGLQADEESPLGKLLAKIKWSKRWPIICSGTMDHVVTEAVKTRFAAPAILGEGRLRACGGCLGRRPDKVVARARRQNEPGGVNERISGGTRFSEPLQALDGTCRSLGTLRCMVVGTHGSVAVARIGAS